MPQSNQDQALRECGAAAQELIDWMASLGFEYTDVVSNDVVSNHKFFRHKQTKLMSFVEQAQFWYTTLQQSNRQLLDEVENIGPKMQPLPREDDNSEILSHMLGYNQAADQSKRAIKQIRERRGL